MLSRSNSWLHRLIAQSPLSWDNWRSQPRLALRLPLQLGSKPAELVNLSKGGLRLMADGPLRAGQSVVVCPSSDLNLVGRHRARCQVIWCRRHYGLYQIGLGWNDLDCWIQSVWQKIQPDWRTRRHLRVRCQFPVWVTLSNGRVLEGARCLDMSVGGCLLRLEGWIAAGTMVSLGFGPDRLLELRGEVLGFRAGKVHIRFSGPPNQRLRGFLSNLMELHGECTSEPVVDFPCSKKSVRIVSPFTQSLKECGLAPRPKSLEQIFGDRLGLPQVVGSLKLRRLELRGPSLWAARLLPLPKLALQLPEPSYFPF